MNRKYTWKQIGIMRVCKWLLCGCFWLLVLGTVYNIALYLRYKTFAISSVSAGVMSGFGAYSAVWSGISAVFMFLCYRYVSGKLDGAEATEEKESPDVMKALIEFSKKQKELLAEISENSDNYDALKALGEKVEQYNKDAMQFAEAYGAEPKLISYSEYDAKIQELQDK